MPTGPMPGTVPHAVRRAGRSITLLLLLVLSVLGVTLLGAGPAAAVDDTTRPDARVTNGPSCRPGGVVVQVVAGSLPYRVVLATTRHPEGEDAADLAPGATAVLRTGDVAWGETIDSRLEYTAGDGSGVHYVDELVPFTFTRPAQEDCAAIASPAAGTVPAPGPDGGPGPLSDEPVAAGAHSGTSGMPVQVASSERAVGPVGSSAWPLVAAALALVCAAMGLVAVTVRRWASRRPTRGV